MSELGVRELKTHVSEVVRKVREEGKRYIITHRGRAVAAIVPVEEALTDTEKQLSSSSWDELVKLGKRISEGWNSSKTSSEILSDMRDK